MKDFLARQIYLELIHEIFFFFFFPVSTAWILGYKRIADNFLIGVVRINFLEAVRGEKKKQGYLIYPYLILDQKWVRKQWLKPKIN